VSLADTVVKTIVGLETLPGPGAVDPIRNRLFQGSARVKMVDGSDAMSDFGVDGHVIGYDAAFDKLIVDDSSSPSNTQVRLVDPDTRAVVATIAVPPGLHMAAGDARANKLYIFTYVRGGGVLTMVEMSSLAVSTRSFRGGDSMFDFALNEVTGEIYLSGAPAQVYDPAHDTVTALEVFLGGWIVANPATNRVYMTGLDSLLRSRLFEIDGATHAVTTIDLVPVDGSNALDVNPLTNKVYVAVDAGLAVYDATAHVLEATLPMPGLGIEQVLVNRSLNKVYVASSGTGSPPSARGTLSMIDGATNTVTAVGSLAGGVAGINVNPITSRIYTWSLCGPATCPSELLIVDGNGGTPQVVAPITAIGALANDTSPTLSPRFVFTTGAGIGGLPATAVYYQVDGIAGRWQKARSAPDGTLYAQISGVSAGQHTLYAFAVDHGFESFTLGKAWNGGAVRVGALSSYAFTAVDGCATAACADLSLTRTTVPAVGFTGKDALYRIKATNNGPAAATQVLITEALPLNAQFVWASPGCFTTTATGDPPPGGVGGGVATTGKFPAGNLGVGAIAEITVVYRPAAAGTATTTATVDANELDPQTDDNTSTVSISVTDPPTANIVARYRLYSPVSLEHHYTMDANEYAVLGASGAWVQEGQVGRVLDNPGSFNGVQAVPYYRLYNTGTRWHHWTTDPNEYYTLMTFPGWNGEDVAGYIFPTQAPGTTQLYRLTYPFIGGLHHWTIDANEYNTLISTYGWVGEGGSGFVIQ
jgi:uncharacterized repeat protein (TIGR01451 family)